MLVSPRLLNCQFSLQALLRPAPLLCVQPRQFPAHEAPVMVWIKVSATSLRRLKAASVVSLINEQFVSLDRFHSDWTWGRLEIVLSRRENFLSAVFSGLRFNCFHFSNKLRNETWNLSQLAKKFTLPLEWALITWTSSVSASSSKLPSRPSARPPAFLMDDSSSSKKHVTFN